MIYIIIKDFTSVEFKMELNADGSIRRFDSYEKALEFIKLNELLNCYVFSFENKESITRKWRFGDTLVHEKYCSVIGYTYDYYSKKYDKWFSSQHLMVSETQINDEAKIAKKINDIAEEREKDLLEKYNNDLAN